MGNLDKLRAANAAAMEKKAQNKKISDSLVDEIIKEGISFEEAAKQEPEKKEKMDEEIEMSVVKGSETKPHPVQRKPSVEEERISASISLVKKKKNIKSVRKSFALKEDTAQKLKEIADNLETSENDILNQILESVFEDM